MRGVNIGWIKRIIMTIADQNGFVVSDTAILLTRNIATMKVEVDAHIAADAVVAGTYWEAADNAVGGIGCFIGCLSHSTNPRALLERFGLPLHLVRMAEDIFESLPAQKATDLFARIPVAIGVDNKDLSLVHWKLLEAEVKLLYVAGSYSAPFFEPILTGLNHLANGRDWHPNDIREARTKSSELLKANRDDYDDAFEIFEICISVFETIDAENYGNLSNARGTFAPVTHDWVDEASYAAAATIAMTASYKADLGSSTGRLRQRDLLLNLLAEAPVVATGDVN
jgi:hypothetical protein